MKTAVLIVLMMGIVAGGVVGQPKDGDLVFTVLVQMPTTLSYIVPVATTSFSMPGTAPMLHAA